MMFYRCCSECCDIPMFLYRKVPLLSYVFCTQSTTRRRRRKKNATDGNVNVIASFADETCLLALCFFSIFLLLSFIAFFLPLRVFVCLFELLVFLLLVASYFPKIRNMHFSYSYSYNRIIWILAKYWIQQKKQQRKFCGKMWERKEWVTLKTYTAFNAFWNT